MSHRPAAVAWALGVPAVLALDYYLVKKGLDSLSEAHGQAVTSHPLAAAAIVGAEVYLLVHLNSRLLPLPAWLRRLDPLGAISRAVKE